jgi:hypothetical protein
MSESTSIVQKRVTLNKKYKLIMAYTLESAALLFESGLWLALSFVLTSHVFQPELVYFPHGEYLGVGGYSFS